MNIKSLIFIAIGFVMGVVYVSCNGAQVENAVAALIGAASDVSYDNTTSNLSSTTVQGAIDEIVQKATVTFSDLDGTWNFSNPFDTNATVLFQITFDSINKIITSPGGSKNILGCPNNSTVNGEFDLVGNVLLFDDQCSNGARNSSGASAITVFLVDTKLYLQSMGLVGIKQ